ncbi:MAG: hypothetical protein M3Z23_02235, partial [Acidobacteriota bacterium]|nr:hypothetical protein [Acidobacteriota bacterium]
MGIRIVFLILAGLCGGSGANPPFSCSAGRKAVRAAPVHTQSDHALGCTGKDGRWQGLYQERFDDESIAATGQYEGGQPGGVWTFFYRNGARMTHGAFRLGRKEG